mmetsp:Transcript_56392/g.117858  ORF Transcript_56392/g.117858 Transcript_56392/m.117858 type:complete len:84 (-) Transcript_56392:671-922(-)
MLQYVFIRPLAMSLAFSMPISARCQATAMLFGSAFDILFFLYLFHIRNYDRFESIESCLLMLNGRRINYLNIYNVLRQVFNAS